MASMTAAGDRWIYYFKNNEVKDEFNARGLAEVRNQLVFDGLNDKERYAYKQYEKDLLSQKSALFTARIEGIAEGEQIGLQKGEEIAKLDTARKMKGDGLNDELIAKYTGLPLSTIEIL
jgi:predicted transposase/invertase (TIGR01784 family)